LHFSGLICSVFAKPMRACRSLLQWIARLLVYQDPVLIDFTAFHSPDWPLDFFSWCISCKVRSLTRANQRSLCLSPSRRLEARRGRELRMNPDGSLGSSLPCVAELTGNSRFCICRVRSTLAAFSVRAIGTPLLTTGTGGICFYACMIFRS